MNQRDVMFSHPKLESLQAFRAGGMFMVLFGHMMQLVLHSARTPYELNKVLGSVLLSGEWALDLFFVGSGFVVLYVTASSFGQKGARANFLLRRFTRVIPVYWVFLTIPVLMMVFFSTMFKGFVPQASFIEVVKSYLFIPYTNITGEQIVPRLQPWPVLPTGWTLNFEMFFYVSFALFLGFSLKRGLIYYGLFLVTLIAIHTQVPQSMGALYFWTTPQAIKFYAGCLVGYAFVRGVYFDVSFRMVILGIAIAILGNCAWYVSFGMAYMYAIWFHIMPAIFCASIVALLVLTPVRYKDVPNMLVRMGDASYSVYLSHFFVLMVCLLLPIRIFQIDDFAIRLILGVANMGIALCVGHWICFHLERPLTLKVRSYIFGGKAKAGVKESGKKAV